MDEQPNMSTLPIFIFILYLFQGILYGLQVNFLPITLRNKGLSLSFIGSLNLLALPWIFKSLWAPAIDLYCSIRSWLTITLTGILTCLFLVHLTQEGTLFSLITIILNIFSATHELVIGKILLRQLKDEQLKTASSYKVFAYKAGSLLGGGATIWISSVLELTNQVFLIMSAIYFALLFFTIFLIPENVLEKPEVMKTRDSQMVSCAVPEVKAKSFDFSGVSLFITNMSRGSKWMVTCLLVYKFASHSSHLLFTMALVDRGVKVSNIGLMSGVIGHVISLLVAMVIGIMLSQKRFSSMSILFCVSLLDVLSVLVQIFIVFSQNAAQVSTNTVFFSFCLQHIVLGAQAIPVFSITLMFCQREHSKYQTTQHSLYTTLDTLGSKFSSFIAGLMADFFGYAFGLCISFLASIAFLFLVVKGPKEREIERQHAKRE
ncbi:major facilitator superfamily domain-containing protein 3-like [Actinia tenebrosa]|uniref:Major facilitator superfamily domain-containing protein 3-like n=1 Tax=Actinia tenebrosa TaxID=6105 RepID=A0A6P8J0L7_ACTTE|nr:major facilitator superfamily domain-containing protein 3-like [Actinia tenebrosa]